MDPAVELVPVMESAPDMVTAPAMESVPAVESAPAIETATATESAPALESAPAMESGPAMESAPSVESAPPAEPVQLSADDNCTVAESGKKRTKISKVVKRQIRNAKLRRAMSPKNALMFLNEVRPGNLRFVLQTGFNHGLRRLVYRATTCIDGKQYSGEALTVSQAKTLASEEAIKGIVTGHMHRVGAIYDNGDQDEGPKNKKRMLEDQFPWGGLAGFALHKLFSGWNYQLNPRLPSRRITDDAHKKHPVMLLNELNPCASYREERPGNHLTGGVYRTRVTFNGEEYVGTGRNKKEAKKQAATAALATLGIAYQANH